MGKLFAGTSGWAYPQWKPDFYPPKLAAAQFLGYYGTRLNSVELNYTFRRFPTEKLLTGRQTGAGALSLAALPALRFAAAQRFSCPTPARDASGIRISA